MHAWKLGYLEPFRSSTIVRAIHFNLRRFRVWAGNGSWVRKWYFPSWKFDNTIPLPVFGQVTRYIWYIRTWNILFLQWLWKVTHLLIRRVWIKSTGIKFFMTEEATVLYLLFHHLVSNEEHFFNDFELVLIFGDNFSYQN